MKRVLMVIVALLLPFMAANAVVFNPSLYGYQHKEKELRKFYDRCVWSWSGSTNLSEKKYLKMQETYEQLIKKYPEDRYLTMLYYGYFNIARNCPIASKEEGFKLIQNALPNLSDSIPKALVAIATANIACCYLKGIGTAKDDKQSFAYYQKAFEIDSAYADNIAYLYYTGVGTDIDEERAFSLLHYCYDEANASLGKPQNWSFKSFDYLDCYEKLFSILSLEKDDVDSLTRENYRDGIRFSYIYNDYNQAKHSFEKAAERGLPNAMYELGLLYYNLRFEGFEGMDKQEMKEKRNQWLEKAAKANYYPAIYKQGQLIINVNATFVAQENKAKADAYPYFKQLADIGYGPAVVMVNNYEKNGWPKEANLFGDIAKGVLSVAAMGSSIKNDGVAAGLTSQMHNTGEQYGEINTVDDFLGALQIQNEQMKAQKRGQTPQDYSSQNDKAFDDNDPSDYSDSSVGGSYSSGSKKSTGKTTSRTSSTSGTSSKSTTSKSTSSNNKSTGATTRNCRKCGGAGKVTCSRCKGNTRTKCAGCDGRGYNTVVGAGKRKCSICDGKGTTRCTHCNGSGKEKCLACNGKGQVRN